uniref:Histidine kinase/HSP90-like ATPase domain-containing protein n=1 Tax=Paramoeba aestuarina TaxID=180227 RepID=A0A7S4KQU5_9EUKA|mmetsp:Transcript_23327/g.36380  ORF Transcript_23327/g.36380 Transcript_23327/m.36380 type:complete len:766 (+) Transcript_23327:34-2331(+)
MRLWNFALLLLVGSLSYSQVAVGESEPAGGHSYQAEVSKMLEILIHSLYTNRSIFLREIISNASDALDKIKYQYLTNPKHPKNKDGEEPGFDIHLKVDHEKRTLSLRDGGVGMTKDELVAHLGSLGASGTKKFVEKLDETESKTPDDVNTLIGQFGVGFYSVFLVSDTIKVISKSDNSDKQWIWESKGDGKFQIYEDPEGNTLGRGTELLIYLKKDADEYMEEFKLKEIIHRYSQFVHFPIYLWNVKPKEKPKDKDDEDKDKEEESDIVIDEEEDKPEEESVTEATPEPEVEQWIWEHVNEHEPIWVREQAEVTEDEYVSFYKSMSHEYEDPMFHYHFASKGDDVGFKSILYVPGRAPHEGYDARKGAAHDNIRLYVRRIFITDEFKDLLPRYLSFVRGVVDSDDLPLNVSREILQESSIIKLIKKKLVRKCIEMFIEMAENESGVKARRKLRKKKREDGGEDYSYSKFWREFGKNIRLGIIEDGSNRQRLARLLRYPSSTTEMKSSEASTSLDAYVKRMKPRQKDIFYVTGESSSKLSKLAVVEDARNHGIEVLLMDDAIDEYVVASLTQYDGKNLVNLSKEGVHLEELTDYEKEIEALREKKYASFIEWFNKIIEDKTTRKVHKIVLGKRKTEQPLVLSSPSGGMTPNLARILKGQTLGDNRMYVRDAEKIIEINYLHPAVDEIFNRYQENAEDDVAINAALLLYETACHQSAFEIDEVHNYAARMYSMIAQGLDVEDHTTLLVEKASDYEAPREEAKAEEEL